MLRKKGKTKGITLIALVITVIVLLILAGITINALAGDNRIIKKSNRSKRTASDRAGACKKSPGTEESTGRTSL